MNVARLELCKELYELSGWGDARLGSWVHDRYHNNVAWDITAVSDRLTDNDEILHPAYDLGYLLRKLPLFIVTKEGGLTLWKMEGKYLVGYPKHNNTLSADNDITADTPEDALCKLAIELFKQGILG